uniref:uncharacterized protein isoform X2 n=1 Tax=Myxine glutinosa TaxID=7769 RepID=UPI00358E59FD
MPSHKACYKESSFLDHPGFAPTWSGVCSMSSCPFGKLRKFSKSFVVQRHKPFSQAMLVERSSSLQISNAQLVAPGFHDQCYFGTLPEQLQALILLLEFLARDFKKYDLHTMSAGRCSTLTNLIKMLAYLFRTYTMLLRAANLKELLDCFLPVAKKSIEEMVSLGFDVSPFSESYKQDMSLIQTLYSRIASRQHNKENALKTKIAPKCSLQPFKMGYVIGHVEPKIKAGGGIVNTGIVSKCSQRKRKSTSIPELFCLLPCVLLPKLPRPEGQCNISNGTNKNANVSDKCPIVNNNNAENGSVAENTQAPQSLQHGPTPKCKVLKGQHLPEIKDSKMAATKMCRNPKRPPVARNPKGRAKLEPGQPKQLKQLKLSSWKLS